MASVFDDEEEEQGTPGSRVAAALAAMQEEEPADDGADTRAGSQEEARQTAQGALPNDNSAQDIANDTLEGTSNPPQEEINTDEPPANDDESAAQIAGAPNVQAPQRPTLQPVSQRPEELAQKLANEKSDFANNVAAGKYKPSGWRKAGSIAAGIALAPLGVSRAMKVGSDVWNQPLNKATANEGREEAATQADIGAANATNNRINQENKNAQTEYGLEERDMRNKGYVAAQEGLAEQRNANAEAKRNALTSWTPKDPNNPAAGGTGRTTDGRTVENVPPPDSWMKNWAKSPEGVAAATRMTIDARRQQADSIFGKGNSTDKQQWIATGKIAKAASVKIPSAQKEQYDDWKAAFKKENGRDPNAAEIQAQGHHMSGAVSKNLTDRIISQKNIAIAKAQADYRAGKITKDDYLNSWQEAQNDFEQRLQEATGDDIHHVTIRDNVDPNTLEWHGEAPAQSKPQGQPQQASPKQAAPSAQQAKPQQAAQPSAPAAGGNTFQYKGATYSVNQKITVGGKPAIITGVNPKTGKPIVKIQG